MSFANKVVIVTGASSGIGAATAVELSKQGADVVLVARNQAKLAKVTADCERAGRKPLVVNADLVKQADADRVIDSTIKKYGKIDVLVNNAGFGVKSLFQDADAFKVFDDIMALNLRAVVYLTQLALPHLIKTKGNVVNISSMAAKGQCDGLWAYCTSKAALDHFTRCVAAELGPKGVRVNTVNPGPVWTDFAENMGLQNPDAFFARIGENIPLQRVSDPIEIVDVVLFMASDRARGVTGSSWVTDNGTLVKPSF